LRRIRHGNIRCGTGITARSNRNLFTIFHAGNI